MVIPFPIRLTYASMNNPHAYKTLHLFGFKFIKWIYYLLFIHTSGRCQRSRCMTKLTFYSVPVVQILSHTHTHMRTHTHKRELLLKESPLSWKWRCGVRFVYIFYSLFLRMYYTLRALSVYYLVVGEEKEANKTRLNDNGKGKEWGKNTQRWWHSTIKALILLIICICISIYRYNAIIGCLLTHT